MTEEELQAIDLALGRAFREARLTKRRWHRTGSNEDHAAWLAADRAYDIALTATLDAIDEALRIEAVI